MSTAQRSMAVGLAAVLALVAAVGGAVAAGEKMMPVPAVTIMPGDPIKDGMLVDRAFAPNFPGAASFVDSRATLLGRVARRTLMPGQPIPTNAIEESRVVTRGVPVKVVVEDGGLVIIAYGTPLQSGGVGALIRVRNVDTGIVVMGIVQPDGTIRVHNG